MPFGRSDAENIYNDWATRARKNALTHESIKDGTFHKLYVTEDNFKPIVDKLLTAELEVISNADKQHLVEQIWKLIDKMERRHGETAAWELMQRIWKEKRLTVVLELFEEKFEDLYKVGTDTAQQAKIGRAHLAYKHLMKVDFRETNTLITLGRILGKGGMGGAVYLGTDQAGSPYAVKRFPGSYQASKYHNATGKNAVFRHQEILRTFAEADATTTCLDYTVKGADQYLLLEMGEPCDYTKIKTADVVNIYKDLDKLENYALQMDTHVTEDVMMLHLDIHGENLMYFKDKLRLIDFGMFLMFNKNPELMEKVVACDLNKLIDSKKLQYYWRYAIEEAQSYANAKGLKWLDYISTWHDYGSNADKVDGFSLEKLRPHHYGNVVLTTVLIKEILAAQAKRHGYDFYPKSAPAIVNKTSYKLARDAMASFKAQGDEMVLLVDLLLNWYDEMMLRLYKGENIRAQDAVIFFTGGVPDAPIERMRSMSVFF